MQFRPLSKIFFWFFVSDFIILTIIGGQPVEEPWVIVGQIASVAYFAYFLILHPLLGILENKLLKL
jgi:ubiquinol-cytochrome c reductase cytochrome b subunit